MTLEWFWNRFLPVTDTYVYKSPAYVSLKSMVNQLSSDLVDLTKPATSPADHRILAACRLIRPMTAERLELVRVGDERDGGYVMANDFDARGAISIGIGPNASWDREVAERGVPVAMFDHTIRRPPEKFPNSRFHQVGIGQTDSGNIRSLDGLLRISGFHGDEDLLLKMDVEGHEWNALFGLSGEDLLRYRQIVLELHDLRILREPQSADRVLKVLELLSGRHTPIHVHANNYTELIRFGSIWFPDVVEVTYVRSDLYGIFTPSRSIHSPLDRPCDPRVPEIDLEGLIRLS
jgi:hypothetical protein